MKDKITEYLSTRIKNWLSSSIGCVYQAEKNEKCG